MDIGEDVAVTMVPLVSVEMTDGESEYLLIVSILFLRDGDFYSCPLEPLLRAPRDHRFWDVNVLFCLFRCVGNELPLSASDK